MGGFGTGKSSALVCLQDSFYLRAWRMCEAEKANLQTPEMFISSLAIVVFQTTQLHLCGDINQEWDFSPMYHQEPQSHAKYFMRKDCVVMIDEWGLYPKEYDNKSLVRLALWIDWRWQWRLPTVIVTNWTQGELEADPLYARMFDRFTDKKWAMVYTLGGESRRRNG